MKKLLLALFLLLFAVLGHAFRARLKNPSEVGASTIPVSHQKPLTVATSDIQRPPRKDVASAAPVSRLALQEETKLNAMLPVSFQQLEALAQVKDQPWLSWVKPLAEIQTDCRTLQDRQYAFVQIQRLLKRFPPSTTRTGKLLLLLTGSLEGATEPAMGVIKPFLQEDQEVNAIAFTALAQKPRAGRPLRENENYWDACFLWKGAESIVRSEDYREAWEQAHPEMSWALHHSRLEFVMEFDLNTAPIPAGSARERLLKAWEADRLGSLDAHAVLGYALEHCDCPEDVVLTAKKLLADPSAGASARALALNALSYSELPDSPAEWSSLLRQAYETEAESSNRNAILQLLSSVDPDAARAIRARPSTN